MSSINLAAVMEGIAQACLDAEVIDRAYGWPNPSITPPALVVGYPEEEINIYATFQGGASRLMVPAWAVFGNVDDRSARDTCSTFLLGISHAINGPHDWCQSAFAGTVALASTASGDGALILTARFDVDVLT